MFLGWLQVLTNCHNVTIDFAQIIQILAAIRETFICAKILSTGRFCEVKGRGITARIQPRLQHFIVFTTDLKQAILTAFPGSNLRKGAFFLMLSVMTIGQYLQPSEKHLYVQKYYPPEDFAKLKEEGCFLPYAERPTSPAHALGRSCGPSDRIRRG
jgi:hypothetical protein